MNRIRIKSRLHSGVLAALVLLVSGAVLADWVRPSLDGLPESVRSGLESAEQRMTQLLQADADPVTLANAWMALGDVYLAHEFRTEARSAYEQALALQPDRSDLHYRIALLAILDGDQQAALAALDRSLALPHPDVIAPARVRRGRLLLDAGEYARAREDFERVLALDPDNAAALEGLGRALLGLGQPREAIDALNRALALAPEADRIHAQLGAAWRALGEVDRARAALAQAGENEPALHDPVLEQIQSLSQSPQFFLEAGLAQADQGQFERAAALIARAVAIAPDDPRLLSAYGQVLVEAGGYALAAKAFDRLAEVGTPGAMDLAYMARIASREGRLDEAERLYSQALAAEPGLTLAREGRARVWLAMGRHAAAAGEFGELAASRQDPGRRAALEYWQGLARLVGGDCEGARAALETAMARVDRPGPSLMQALIRLRATCPGTDPTLMTQAVEWAEAIYDASPDLESSATLAMAYAAAGRFEDAVDLQAQAMFEALKAGTLDRRPKLKADMERYRNGQPAERAYGPDDLAAWLG